MTIIVAARDKKGGVIVAADSLAAAGWEKLHNDRSKLWAAAPYVLGAAGCLRTAQVVRSFTTWPKYRPDEDAADLEGFIVKSMVPAVRTAVQGAGVMKKIHEIETMETTLLVAWADNIARIHGNGAATVPTAGRDAIGSGYAEALGYLGTDGPWTVEQVCTAAHRATLTAQGCEGPIEYMTTTDPIVRRWTTPRSE